MATRLPVGHPEAFIEAFANIYRGAAAAMRSGGGGGGGGGGVALDFPDVSDGERGVRFIHAVVESSREDQRWVSLRE
jgi:hypothetical protein